MHSISFWRRRKLANAHSVEKFAKQKILKYLKNMPICLHCSGQADFPADVEGSRGHIFKGNVEKLKRHDNEWC
jgi:hypothetical protein